MNRAQGEADRHQRIMQDRALIQLWLHTHQDIYVRSQQAAEAKEIRVGGVSRVKKRAQKYDAWVEAVDKRILYEILAGRCGLCGEVVLLEKATIDHIVPLSRGGKHSYANAQIAHAGCNRRKADSLPDYIPL